MFLFRRQRGQDVFERTQSQLTNVFSWQIVLFLFIFILVVYVVLYTVIFQTQQREIRTMVKQEAKVITEYIIQNSSIWQNEQRVVLAGVEQFFYYVVDANGNVLLGDEVIPSTRFELLTIIQQSNLDINEVFKAKILLDRLDDIRKPRDREGKTLQIERHGDIRLLISSAPVFYKGQMIGTLYVGKDITFVYELLQWTLIVLIVFAILFVVAAYYMSNRMSKKAMVPISEAFQRQRQFVADASHELRTPLSVIQSSIEAIEMTVDLADDDFARKLVFNMKDEVKRMTHLLSDLLTLARSDSGTIELHQEFFNLTALVQKVIDSVQPLAQQKYIHLSYDGIDVVNSYGDYERLHQLLYILLDNAIKYTPEDGQVIVKLDSNAQFVTICVQDSGIGISEEEQPFIFERFYRADKVRSRQMGSFGLGLAIAKWIVDAHHGTIHVESKLHQGSTFIVTIPHKGDS